jgi:hypothetical protein
MRGNMLASIILATVIIITASVFTVRTFEVGIQFQGRQQAFTESAIMLEESLKTSIYQLMQRGYNNTLERDAGELWWCNAATPPDMTEVNASLTILARESVETLMRTLRDAGVSATEPTILFDFDDEISSIRGDNVTFTIAEFIVRIEDADGNQSRDLGRTYTYAYRTWAILRGLDAWIREDAGRLSEELDRALNEGKSCLYDSCCCSNSGGEPNRATLIEQNRVRDADIALAIERIRERLEDHMTEGISCRIENRLEPVRYAVQRSQVNGICQSAWRQTCAVEPTGNPTTLTTAAIPFEALCSERRDTITTDPTSMIMPQPMSLPTTDLGSAGSDVVYSRYAVDKELSGELIVRCTDEHADVFIDGDFRPLEAIIRLGVAIYSDCDIDATIPGQTPHPYTSAVCFVEGGTSGGGGPLCESCTALCSQAPHCGIDGTVYAPICDANGNPIPGPNGFHVCTYQDCEDLDCTAPVTCCDGTQHERDLVCTGAGVCQPTQTQQDICEVYESTLEDANGNGIPDVCEAPPAPDPGDPGPGPGGPGDGPGDAGPGPGPVDPGPVDPGPQDPAPSPQPNPPPCSPDNPTPNDCKPQSGWDSGCYAPATCVDNACFFDPINDGDTCGEGTTICADHVCQNRACVPVNIKPTSTQCQPDNPAGGGLCKMTIYRCTSSGNCQGEAIANPDATCNPNAIGCDCTCQNGNPTYSGGCGRTFCGESFSGTCTSTGQCTIADPRYGNTDLCCYANTRFCSSGEQCCGSHPGDYCASDCGAPGGGIT